MQDEDNLNRYGAAAAGPFYLGFAWIRLQVLISASIRFVSTCFGSGMGRILTTLAASASIFDYPQAMSPLKHHVTVNLISQTRKTACPVQLRCLRSPVDLFFLFFPRCRASL